MRIAFDAVEYAIVIFSGGAACFCGRQPVPELTMNTSVKRNKATKRECFLKLSIVLSSSLPGHRD
jgi:hypothetical protein